MRFSVSSLVVAVLVALAVPAHAGSAVTSSLMAPIDNLVFTPGGDHEEVVLSGRVHLVTRYDPSNGCLPTDPCRVFVNLAHVAGVGVESGLDYIAIGAVNLACTPTDPCFPQFVTMPVAVPPNPIVPPNPVLPITFAVTIGFDEFGRLSLDGTTVALGSCSGDDSVVLDC
jgi:hypothetical protein